MLRGTKKIFPTDYDRFVEAMIEAAEEDNLPSHYQMEDVRDITLKDIQDMFMDFQKDTGLEIGGCLYFCPDCMKLHFIIGIDYPEEEEPSILQ